MCRFAPTHLTSKEFFIPSATVGPNASRQRRYNTRRLARSLREWFGLSSRAPSPARDESPDDKSPPLPPPVSLAPASAHQLRMFAEMDEGLDSPDILLALGEVTLCAAVHSVEKKPFINAVLTLLPHQQDALQASIKRTSAPPEEKDENAVLQPVSLNDENRVDAGKLNPRSPHRAAKGDDPLSAPRGIPLAEYKALAGERDGLRKKLAAAEQERSRVADDAEEVRCRLDEAGDRIRELEQTAEGKDEELEIKAKALNDAKNALRDAHVSAEEIDVLRAKAASAEQLEASLKRASKRLEEVADMRRSNKDLETQISAFRENEERISKHTEYLEAQLGSSNERAQQLAVLSDNLSSNLEDKEMAVTRLSSENRELNEKLETANKQLASMLVQSSATHNVDDATTYTAASAETSLKNATETPVKTDNVPEQAMVVVESSREASVFDESIVSEHLFGEIGVRMNWEDIVECIKGVMDALREMDDVEGSRVGTEDEMTSEGNSRFMDDDLVGMQTSQRSQGSSRSQGSDRSEEGNNHDSTADSTADNSESNISVLPDFTEVDSRLKAANTGMGDDEFDFAANQVNVQEISLMRRRSSQLATIPENREGFRSEECLDTDDSSYSSGYTTDETSEPVDATVNATVARSPGSLRGEAGCRVLMTDQRTLAQGNSDHSSSRPDSPLIGDNSRCLTKLESPDRFNDVQMDGSKFPRSAYSSLPSNVRRATSLTISVLGGLRRSPSRSDTTRALVQQARSELDSLQKAMEAMRAERQASASISVLIQQLNAARHELMMAQSELVKKETQNVELRKEITELIKELDNVSIEKKINDEREASILKEKERLVGHLQVSLSAKEGELKDMKQEMSAARSQVKTLQEAKSTMAERLRAAEVIGRAQEVEMARLAAKVDANDSLTNRLNAVVNKTDGLKTQMTQQRENHINDVAEAAKKEKLLAEEARDEARRVAKTHASVLEDVRATAAAAAFARSRSSHERGLPSRKSTRFGDFWRKLLHIEKLNIDYSMPTSTTSMPTMRESMSRKARGTSG